jgi:dethiobiotin synthetase
MGRNYLITGTDVEVGKTTVGCALGFAFKARGMRVGVMKPVETGCARVEGVLDPVDARALALASSCTLPLELICPYRYAAALAPAAAAQIERSVAPDISNIVRSFREIAAVSDVVLVESAGGISVPITWSTNFGDLAAMLDLEVVVVVGNRRGCLNSAVLTLKYADSRGLRVAGYLLCDVEASDSLAASTNEDSLRILTRANYLGRMRHREPLAKSIVEKLL